MGAKNHFGRRGGFVSHYCEEHEKTVVKQFKGTSLRGDRGRAEGGLGAQKALYGPGAERSVQPGGAPTLNRAALGRAHHSGWLPVGAPPKTNGSCRLTWLTMPSAWPRGMMVACRHGEREWGRISDPGRSCNYSPHSLSHHACMALSACCTMPQPPFAQIGQPEEGGLHKSGLHFAPDHCCCCRRRGPRKGAAPHTHAPHSPCVWAAPPWCTGPPARARSRDRRSAAAHPRSASAPCTR